MLITLSAIAFEKFSIKNLKGKNVIKKSINLFMLLSLSAYPFPHIIQEMVGYRTQNKTCLSLLHLYKLKSFIFCNLWKIAMIADRLMYCFSLSVENIFLLIYYTMLSDAKNEILHLLSNYLKDIRQLRFQTVD